MQTTIECLYIYPVKSLSGVPVQQITFNESGPKDDRTYMLVNAKGRFISQRSHPILSTFSLNADENGWLVTAPGGDSILLPKQTYSDREITVTVWRDTIPAYEVDHQASSWFSQQLDENVFLVVLDELSSRTKTYESSKGHFAFADGYPLLVCNASSLDQVNSNHSQHLSMRRFRPNVVISIDANDEYQLQGLRFERGGVLVFCEPCVRCNIPAIDPNSGVFQPETHKFLKQALLREKEVIFGVNAIHQNLSNICIGDVVTGY